MEALDLPNKKAAGAYMADLEKKGLIDIDTFEDEIWVNPDVFEERSNHSVWKVRS